MQTQNKTRQILSYTCGIAIAAIVVGALVLTFYLTSDAYAAQQLAKQSVPELVANIDPLTHGRRPPRGAEQDRVLGSILLLGDGEDQIQQRIDGIATAGSINDTEYESAAQIAIKKLGDASHDTIKEMIDSGDPVKLTKAVVCIKLLGEDAKAFVPKLIEMIESGDKIIARYGVFAMQDMGASATPAVEALNDVIHSLDFNAQIMVCKAVVGIGRDAAPMADNLAQIYQEGVPSIRSWAGIALGAIGPIENFDTAEMLGSRVNTFVHVEKIRALEGLALMGDEATSQKEIIEAAMNKPDGRVRPDAAYAFYRVTGETETPVKTLVEMLASVNYRDASLSFLRLMGPDAEPAIPAVVDMLSNDSVAIQESAVLVLGNMGAVAAGEINAIKRLSSSDDPLLRQAVSESVAAIENDVAVKKQETKTSADLQQP